MAEQITNYQCPACTGPPRFDEQEGKLRCDYCDSCYTVQEVEDGVVGRGVVVFCREVHEHTALARSLDGAVVDALLQDALVIVFGTYRGVFGHGRMARYGAGTQQ